MWNWNNPRCQIVYTNFVIEFIQKSVSVRQSVMSFEIERHIDALI